MSIAATAETAPGIAARRGLRPLLGEGALAAALILAPFVLPHLGATFDLLQRVLVIGLMGLGFDLLFGATGLLSFGQAAFFGTGGFFAAYLLVNHVLGSVWVALVIGTLAAGVFGLFVGWLAVRRIGIYFAMITLAFGQMAFFMENSPLSALTGGENGLPGVPFPVFFGVRLTAGWPLYWTLAAMFFVGFVLARRILHSPFGIVLRAIKDNTARAAMLGHSVPAYKLAVFVIAALYAGLAGGMLGVFQSYMPPDAFSLGTSGDLVVQTVIGGVGTLIGPLVGATIWFWLRDNLQSIPAVGPLWRLILGLVFVVLVIAFRRGIAGEIAWFFRRRRLVAAEAGVPEEGGLAADAPTRVVPLPMIAPLLRAEPAAPALEARGVSKHYGGLRAVDDVSFTVRSGSIQAVIGPNGAGKSTLFKMLADEITPTAGEVRLFGRRVTGLGITRTAQLGIGKSNQLNQLFLELTVAENIRVAALGRRRGTFRADVLRDSTSIAEVERQVAAAMETVGLTHRAGVPVHVLPYGEKRRLEIGMALATGPNVLLLDEPLAGMSPAERIATRALIREIGRSRTLLIVEHDMDAIFELAERITVLYEGRLLADGPPEAIQNDQRVQDAYLGGMHAHEPA
ncbi:MAG TPA: branched-chain amino acid ABC transporter ATP-binding protein/permease [Acetobacteraceae bacterium]|nr:branched-chain amino acid ABC transporter ATP-binding protein/permease [Acetobacteraceae bacterium]